MCIRDRFLAELLSKIVLIALPVLIDMQTVIRICCSISNKYYIETAVLQNICLLSQVFIPLAVTVSYALVGIQFIIVVLHVNKG